MLKTVTTQDLVMQVVANNGGRVTSKQLREAIDAKSITLSNACKRLVETGQLARDGKRGRFVAAELVAEAQALLEEARNAGLDCELEANGRFSFPFETLRGLLDSE